MARLLSLDLATKTGWAFGTTEAGDPVSGVLSLPKTGVELGPYLNDFAQWLNRLCIEHDVEQIVYEEPIMPMGSIRKDTLMKLYNLAGTAERVAHHRKVPVRSVDAGTWKKFFCGRGGFGKSTKPYPPIIKCREYGWQPKDDNEADAIGLWFYGCAVLSPKEYMRFDPLLRRAA
jgi:hypothetical protein